jgi:hypothetical protein
MTMSPNEKDLLKAIHNVELQIASLEVKIDDSVSGRFKDNERRIGNLENNQNKIVWAIISTVLLSLIGLVMK